LARLSLPTRRSSDLSPRAISGVPRARLGADLLDDAIRVTLEVPHNAQHGQDAQDVVRDVQLVPGDALLLGGRAVVVVVVPALARSEEHTSELQSREN